MTRYDDPWTITDDIMDTDDGVDLDAPPDSVDVLYDSFDGDNSDGLDLEWWPEDDQEPA